ncbi:delta-12 fatty acid desaturas-like protein [Apiospora aurea]|uniref:Delta-12 fatty acid desaturas-like protein n=1 Tax=Apiospora aurea TaxID=335848 RepID=A0ABR1QJ24_9PEZI
MNADYTTETVHHERVKSGVIETVVDGKKTRINMQQLRSRVPAHCFRPSILYSLGWVLHDSVIYLALLATALYLKERVVVAGGGDTARILLCYFVFPFLAGLPLTGLWVLAHECGHGAFSTSSFLSNTVGLVLHSALMNPYFAWRSSHGRHHQFANNLKTDLNYVPPIRGEYQELFRGQIDLDHMVEDAPFVVLLRIVFQQLIGWPWYLITHITAGPNSSPKKSRGWWDNSHFLPHSSLFRPSEFWNIVVSDLAISATAVVLYALGERYGMWTMVWTYLLPLMWVNHWIVMITYLHHTSPVLPKYMPESWTYLRGALATVDRDPGPVMRYMFHHIVDLHVVHHLFPYALPTVLSSPPLCLSRSPLLFADDARAGRRIPHYHAQEATNAIRPLLGDYYHVDKSSWWGALYVVFTQCQWVEADVGKTAQAAVYGRSGTGDTDRPSTNDRINEVDREGIMWYRSGPMPLPATVMRSQPATS